MAVIVDLGNTGIAHLYPDGIPIIATELSMPEIYRKVARTSALAVQADPYFSQHTSAQKIFSQLHGEGDRITRDFLSDGATEIAPVFSSLQRYMDDQTDPRFEFDSVSNPNKVIYRWQLMDTREEGTERNYTSETLRDIRIDPNIIEKVLRYTEEALRNYVLKELYRAIGYEKKYIDYYRAYEQSREYVAFWVKNDTSLQTFNYAGV